jgi:Fe-S cluster assembly protein SufD
MSAPAPAAAVTHYRQLYDAVRSSLPGDYAAREAAVERFVEQGLPTSREEAWKYTSLRRLEGRRFELPTADELVSDGPTTAPLSKHRVVLVNGCVRDELASLGALPTGVRIQALRVALQKSDRTSDLLRVPAGGGTERFAALNAALSADGLLIELDADARLDEPLHVTTLATGGRTLLTQPRIIVRAARGSRARIILEHVGDDSAERLVNAVVEVVLEDRAEVHLYRLQQEGARTFHVERIDATVARDARFNLHDASLGGTLARLDVNVSLDASGAATLLSGLFLADGSRHLDTHIRVDHRGVSTQSHQDYRGIGAGRGRGVFNGKAIVHPDAQKTDARQSSRNLLLSPGAEIDTKPELEIYADDVKCSHGATTGQLDPAALFYLRSRGMDEAEARSALTRAFAGTVLSRMDHAGFCKAVHDALDLRLDRLLESPA